jgi:O-antigen ligase
MAEAGLYSGPAKSLGRTARPPVADPASAGWTPGTYFWVMVLVGVPGVVAVALAAAAGEPWVGAVIAAVPFGLLVIWKPEIGVFLLAIVALFEDYAEVVGGAVTLTKVVGIGTLPVLLAHGVGYRKLRIRSPAFWLAVAFALWSLLTMVTATVPEVAWHFSLRRIQMAGLIFLVVNACLNRNQTTTFYWSLFIGALLAAVAAFFLAPAAGQTQIAQVTLGRGPNRLGKVLMSALFLGPWLLTVSRPWLKMLVVTALLLVAASYAATGSRQAYIALLPGVVVAVLAYRGTSLPRRTLLLLVFGGLLVAAAVVALWVGVLDPQIYDRFVELREEGLEAGHRLKLWTAAWKTGLEHPITGVGAGNVKLHIMQYGLLRRAHNEFLQHFAELGIPGLTIYLGFLVAVYWQLRRVADPVLKACLLGLFVSANVASLAAGNAEFKPFWLQMGACMVAGMQFGRAAPAKAVSALEQQKKRSLQKVPPPP